MAKQNRNIIFTTIAIEAETDKLIEKLCKRYSLKKGEIVKLAFLYLDKAHLNPADAPESVKSELAKSTDGRMILFASFGSTRKTS